MNKNVAEIFSFHRSELNSYNTNSIHKFVALCQLDLDFTPCILVGGTNGKGSICKILSTIYQESGLKVGLFVSPHLDSYHERIQINHKKITDQSFLQIYQGLSPKIQEASLQGIHLSFFELILISSLIYFKQNQVDLVIYEVGLGGKRDATQILKPNFTAISNVSLDHTHILGGDLKSIAHEKSGVIFEKTPFLYAQNDELTPIFKNSCFQKKSPFIQARQLISKVQHTQTGFKGRLNWDDKQAAFQASLNGEHQAQNLNTALNILLNTRSLHEVTLPQIVSSLSKLNHECRLEVISHSPLIIVDGSHNLAGIQSLSNWLTNYFENYQISICLSLKVNKDHTQIISILKKNASVSVYKPRAKSFVNPKNIDPSLFCYPNYHQIYDDFFNLKAKNKVLIFTGSLKSAIIQKKYFQKYKKKHQSTKYFQKP
ncbi:MAG: hypothetical protein KC646_12015 [Candidatus Cloacimonetes bacterium]|nr:hypothetical protein [Candidatus Cloacimonadota bacterium]